MVEKYLIFAAVFAAIVCTTVPNESESIGTGLSALLNAQILSQNTQAKEKIAHDTHGNIQGNTQNPQVSSISDIIPQAIQKSTAHDSNVVQQNSNHGSIGISNGPGHGSNGVPQVAALDNLVVKQNADHSLGVPQGAAHDSIGVKQNADHNLGVPHSGDHGSLGAQDNIKQGSAHQENINNNNQSQNKSDMSVNPGEHLLPDKSQNTPSSHTNVKSIDALSVIQEEALNIPVTIRIMFPHYIQVRNEWYPLKLRFGVPQA